MSKIIKSKSKYVCKDADKLKEFLLKEGFIFKNSNVRIDEYYIDQNMEMLDDDSCIRIRTINNKETPDAFSEEWWRNTTETAKATTISTIIMNLLRGSGISGLKGIEAKRGKISRKVY